MGTAGAGSTDTLTAAIGTDPTSFDPAKSRAQDDYYVNRLLYDTLLRKDENNTLAGGLATDWTATSASDYSFTIRDDATCADGTEITPSIIAASLARFLDPKTSSPGRTLALGTAQAIVTADDGASSVRIQLSEDWSDLPTGLTLPHSGIVCPAGLENLDGLAAGTVPGAISGPYTITSAQAAVSYELSLRDDYIAWPEFKTPLEGAAPKILKLTPISDQATLGTQLLSGGLDIGTLTDENVSRFADQDGFTSASASSMTTYLIFNERPGTVFADKPDLRKAVSQAIDPAAYRDVVTDGRGTVLTSVGSPNVACVNPDASLVPALDTGAAAAALAGVSINLVGTTAFNAGNEYVAELLRKAGANVNLQSVDNANWSSVTTAGGTDWDLTLQGDVNVTGTLVSSLLRVMGPATEDGGRNKSGVINEEGYAAVRRAMSETDPAAQCEALQAAQESFLSRVDAMPLSDMPNVVISAEGVSMRSFGDYFDPATLRIIK